MTEKLHPKHLHLIREVADGATIGRAAKTVGFNRTHAGRIVRSELGQAELARLRSEAETLLMKRLSGIVALTLQSLEASLLSQNLEARTKAIEITMKYLAGPLLAGLEAQTLDDAIISDNHRHGGLNHEDDTSH